MAKIHRYKSDLVWSGSTGAGYRAYDRAHRVSAPPASTELAMTADPTFGGDENCLNPEQLLLTAASSCQLLAFLAEAATAGIDVWHYEDDAEALMPHARERMSITEIILRPQIVVAPGTDLEAVREMVHTAHEGCFIANSLTTRITLEPSIEHARDNDRADQPQPAERS